MLAERRSKQKWSLNPRGKQWSDDSNKFGQKMLEKMGWTNGKGLGSNEQGPTEHVRVRVKNNRVGIGFEDKEDQWTQHQDDYGKLLQQLQESNNLEAPVKDDNADNELSGKSLELKSKHSRARVHYHKFTRGKDVNKYSTKDLANIFGKKDLREKNNSEKEQDEDSKEVPEPVGSADDNGGFLTINGGNITDYFKKKLPDFMNKDSYHDSVQKTNSDSDSDQQYDFKVVGFKSDNTVSQSDQESSKKQQKNSTNVFDNLGFDLNQPDSKSQTPKKRKKEFVFENEGLDLEYPEKLNTPKRMRSNLIIQSSSSTVENIKEVTCSNGGFVNTALNLNSPTDESHNGIEFEVSRSQLGLDNGALDLTDEIKKKKRVTFNDTVEFNVDTVKRKKNKAKLDKFEVENEKLKKKQKNNTSETYIDASKKVIGFVNEALDVDMICEEINDNELNERKSKKAKRKKSKKVSNLETIEEASEEDKDKGCEVIAEIEVITLTENMSDVDNSINSKNMDANQNDEELGAKVLKKKKKKNKKEKVEEKTVAADNVETAESGERESVKKKSRRKKEYREEILVTDETPKKKKNKKERKEVIVADEVGSEEKDSIFNKENTENRQDDIDSEKKKKKEKVIRR